MLIVDQLRKNLTALRQEICHACARGGRSESDVRLVAVTKYAEWPWVQELAQLHQTFGENRPQQLAERHTLLPHVEWHLIGQLQRNKVRQALQHATLIHSVDSLKLLDRIAEIAKDLQQSPRVLLQVNVSGEASKSGFSPDQIRHEWPSILLRHPQVQVVGLMTMAPESENAEEARPTFRQLRQLRDELAERPDSAACGISLAELSMGMSGDFIPAIEEGATLVRIGSRVFTGL